jgi:hypothetical protein
MEGDGAQPPSHKITHEDHGSWAKEQSRDKRRTALLAGPAVGRRRNPPSKPAMADLDTLQRAKSETCDFAAPNWGYAFSQPALRARKAQIWKAFSGAKPLKPTDA